MSLCVCVLVLVGGFGSCSWDFGDFSMLVVFVQKKRRNMNVDFECQCQCKEAELGIFIAVLAFSKQGGHLVSVGVLALGGFLKPALPLCIYHPHPYLNGFWFCRFRFIGSCMCFSSCACACHMPMCHVQSQL